MLFNLIVIFVFYAAYWPVTAMEEFSNTPGVGEHHPAFTRDLREALVDKGKKILQNVLTEPGDLLPPEAYFQKSTVEIFNKSVLNSFKDTSYFSFLPRVSYNRFFSSLSIYDPLYRQTALEDVIAVCWALDAAAIHKGQAFKRGSFSVIDDDEKLYSFFKSYAQVGGNVTSIDQLGLWGANAYAYDRTPSSDCYLQRSSHYPQNTRRQIGIDMQFDDQQGLLPLLPRKDCHLLIGRVKTGTDMEKTFIKFEPIGLGQMWAFLVHGKEWLWPSIRDHLRREKDLPLEVIDGFHAVMEAYSHTESAKDCLFLKKYKMIEPKLQKNKNSMGNADLTNVIDIAQMYIFCKNYTPSLKVSLNQDYVQDDVQNAIVSFLHILTKKYGEENFDYRTGYEVVLIPKDIVN